VFGEPISPSIATTTAVVAPAPPPESNTTRPRPLWKLYNHHHRILHTLQCRHTSHLHTRNRHLCVSHTAPRERFRYHGHQRNGEFNGQGQSQWTTHSPLIARGSPYASISYAMFEGEDLHMAMWIPAPHAIEGYASGIPIAGPLLGGQSVRRVFDAQSTPSSGHATDADAAAALTATTACSKSR